MNDAGKAALKRLARGLARFAILPEVVAYEVAARVMERDVAFHHASQWMSLLPGYGGIYARGQFYRSTLQAYGPDGQMSFGTVLSHADTRIGDRVYFGVRWNIGRCEIGEDVLFGRDVHVLSGKGQHQFDDPDRRINEQGGHFEVVHIGRDVWIGNGARVLADVGDRAIVGTGAVAVRPVPPGAIVGGNPARILGQRP